MALALTIPTLVAAVTACGGKPKDPDAKTLVLQLSELPHGFTRTEARYTSNTYIARKNKIRRSRVEGWGRIVGYTAIYERRAVTDQALFRDPVSVISTVSIQRTERGAHAAFLWGISGILKRGSRPVHTTSVARVGDESRVFTTPLKQGNVVLRVYLVQWRETRFVGTVVALGVDGKLRVESALKLARRQEAHQHLR